MIQIESDNLYKVLRDFHTLTGARIELLDPDLKTLMFYPPKKIPFCRRISTDPALGPKCVECDRYNSQMSAKAKRVLHYRCHMGLMEAVAPIMDDDEILAYVMFGQVLMQETCDETRRALRKRFADTPLREEMDDAIAQIPVKSAAELSASVTILQSLVTYVLSNQWIAPEKSEFIRHLDAFIFANVSHAITVDDLCMEFHIKRTRLYGIAKQYLGCSIASYIRQKRIEHACRLLKQTNRSVTAIADAVGFSDYRHFSRIFLKTMGVSATKYRKRELETAKTNR